MTVIVCLKCCSFILFASGDGGHVAADGCFETSARNLREIWFGVVGREKMAGFVVLGSVLGKRRDIGLGLEGRKVDLCTRKTRFISMAKNSSSSSPRRKRIDEASFALLQRCLRDGEGGERHVQKTEALLWLYGCQWGRCSIYL